MAWKRRKLRLPPLEERLLDLADELGHIPRVDELRRIAEDRGFLTRVLIEELEHIIDSAQQKQKPGVIDGTPEKE